MDRREVVNVVALPKLGQELLLRCVVHLTDHVDAIVVDRAASTVLAEAQSKALDGRDARYVQEGVAQQGSAFSGQVGLRR